MNSRVKNLTAGILATAALATVLFSSCAPRQNKGADLPARGKPIRIASMAPSSTVILADLGIAGKIVACDTWSGSVPGVPSSATRFDMMKPDAERLASLEPDLILVSTMTQAGTSIDPFKPLADSGVRVVYVQTSESLEGIENDVTAIAAVVGEEKAGEKIVKAMRADVAELRRVADGIPKADRKTAYFEISPAPWMYSFGSGVYLDDALGAAGLANILGDKKGWLAVNAETIVAKNPDVILTNADAGAGDPAESIMARPGWEGISAIRNRKVFAIDTRTSSQPTPDVIKAIRQIAEAVYPEYFK